MTVKSVQLGSFKISEGRNLLGARNVQKDIIKMRKKRVTVISVYLVNIKKTKAKIVVMIVIPESMLKI